MDKFCTLVNKCILIVYVRYHENAAHNHFTDYELKMTSENHSRSCNLTRRHTTLLRYAKEMWCSSKKNYILPHNKGSDVELNKNQDQE